MLKTANITCRSSFSKRNADHQRFMMHHKPILYLRFPFLINNARGLGEAEVPQNPAEHQAHLY